MKNYEIIQRKNARQIVKNVALIACLGFAGFSLPLANGQIQSVQKTTTAPQIKTVRRTLSPVKVSETELNTINATLSAKTITRTQPSVATTSIIKPIDVTSPVKNDIWDAGNEYTISWRGATNDVRIDLVSLSGDLKTTTTYPIANRAPNTGNYHLKVPYNWVKGPQCYVYIETVDGKQWGVNQGTINVCTKLVDLECKIVDASLSWSSSNYVFYAERSKWLEFNVLMRNKGTMSPVTIQEVLVRLIKEPENIVVVQEEWGFSGIYGHEWRRLPEPIKYDIQSSWSVPYYRDVNVNLKSGSYRLEVALDPQNRLGEDQQTRGDNKCVQYWDIR